jgi:hypothetical protein
VSLLRDELEEEGGLTLGGGGGEVVYGLPKRVLVKGHDGARLCDYLFPSDAKEDVEERLVEYLGVSADSVAWTDLELQTTHSRTGNIASTSTTPAAATVSTAASSFIPVSSAPIITTAASAITPTGTSASAAPSTPAVAPAAPVASQDQSQLMTVALVVLLLAVSLAFFAQMS